MMGLRRIREPSEIKWGLRHEGKFFSRFSLHPTCYHLGIFLHVADFFPPRPSLCPTAL